MDLSALIFVALAVAWAAYLIPKALSHHEEDQRSRTVDRFSSSMRVLARREPVGGKDPRLVVPAKAPVTAATSPVADRPALDRPAARRAARRRRRVLGLLLVACATVATLAALAVVAWAYVAIPAGLLVAWLVACRLMVRSERAARRAVRPVPASAPVDEERTEEVQAVVVDPDTGALTPVVGPDAAPAAAAGSWDPVPVTLPTYVGKEVSHRSVRTIDLDSTGVWTSGRTEADAALAREADEAAQAAKAAQADAAAERRRATGS